MSKANKLYKIFMTSMIVIIAGLLLATGIIAIQKSMKMNLSFEANPNYLFEVYIQKSGDDTKKLVFRNYEKSASEGLVMENGFSTLYGNTLTADDTFLETYGGDFEFIIENHTKNSGMRVSVTANSETEGGHEGILPTITEDKMTATKLKDGSTADYIRFSVTTTEVVFPQTTVLNIVFSEYNEYTVSVTPSSGNFTFSDTTNKIAVSDEDYTANVKAITGYNLTISITNDGGTTTLKQNTDYTWDSSTGALTIYASAVTGNITITCTNNNEITYQIAYNSNGGSGTMSNSSHTYGVPKNLTSCTFTAQTNKKFAGWAITRDGSVEYTDGESVSNLSTTQDEVVTLYAVWEDALPYTIYQYGDTANGAVAAPNDGWTGYRYIVFDNCTTYNGYDLRWIIIGTGASNTTLIPDSDSTIPDSATNSGELDEDEVLLLSEQVLFTDAFRDAGGSALWSNSDLQLLLNGTFLTETGLGEYAVEKTLKTTSSNEATGDETTDQIFLLAYSGADSTQSYCVETYLGEINSSSQRACLFSGASSSYWWLRSGYCKRNYGAYSVYNYGDVNYADVDSSIGVRPSFVLNLA